MAKSRKSLFFRLWLSQNCTTFAKSPALFVHDCLKNVFFAIFDKIRLSEDKTGQEKPRRMSFATKDNPLATFKFHFWQKFSFFLTSVSQTFEKYHF